MWYSSHLKDNEENGDKEGSTRNTRQLANALKQGIPTQLKSIKVCMYSPVIL